MSDCFLLPLWLRQPRLGGSALLKVPRVVSAMGLEVRRTQKRGAGGGGCTPPPAGLTKLQASVTPKTVGAGDPGSQKERA